MWGGSGGLGEDNAVANMPAADAGDESVRRLYTPAMLAELLGVPVATVRRWRRRGLIVPAQEVRRLAYYDFPQVAAARRLAQLLAGSSDAVAVERRLAELVRRVGPHQPPLAQLDIQVEGRRVLVRQGAGLIDPAGQHWIDFDSLEPETAGSTAESATISFPRVSQAEVLPSLPSTPAELLAAAAELEDDGQLELAVDAYRTVLAAGGPRADVCFQLAEALYRLGDVSAARERYYMAVELDEDYVEARANLGCVLAETGQRELALAAFQGALAIHASYADVHYHLARLLDDCQRSTEAESHWQMFLDLAPDSPWADEARLRLAAR